jgi:replicative DNA helicase
VTAPPEAETCDCGRPLIARAGELEQTCGECRSRPSSCDYPPLPGTGPGGPGTLLERLLPGGCILDVPAVPDAVWGDGEDILWAHGQSLIIAGPDGTGKTTLAGNLIQARLGLGPGTVLSQPVKPGERNVLVLLMDRPQQAMAALGRLFTEDDRDFLNARLRVWRGPPPQDPARNTTMLTQLCADAGADTCVIDSLKDAAIKLSDDETGSGWNQARQYAIEAGTQLLELHHPRKKPGREPQAPHDRRPVRQPVDTRRRGLDHLPVGAGR